MKFKIQDLTPLLFLAKTKKPDTRLQRRVQQIEKLPAKERRQLTQLIDTFIKASQMEGTEKRKG